MRLTDEQVEIFTHINYAHRGLYDNENGVPENSMKAFFLAVEAGYGVELDVQLSKDGQVIVFHDDALDRMCGTSGKIWDYTFEELRGFRLLGTKEQIPLFSQVLEILGKGTGPLIVEIKNGPVNYELCRKTREILKTYRGNYCIESFNPLIVKWFKDNEPSVVRGQLATGPEGYGKKIPKFAAKLMSECFLAPIIKPDFIAYKNIERPKKILKMRKKGILLFAWTSRVPEVDQAMNDAVIFEGYRPGVRY